ncbi:MAG: hypothetical protein LBI05_07170, partial [Planctomycetaceae bacterium]|nr:hypothetical protein [Planctomycetaceae bacterium]
MPRCLAAVLLMFLGFMPTGVCAPQGESASPLELFDKAQAALIWFYLLGDEVAMNRMPAEKYHEQIPPMELIHVTALLHSSMEPELVSLAEKLLPMLPYYKLTSEELFEIQDVQGETDLVELAAIATPYITSIPVEARRFRRNSLNSAEKVILEQEPATALELMKAVDVLSSVGHPVLVRHYLRKFLAGTPSATPEQSAEIVETIGTQRLMQLAIHPEFEPLGKETVAKIIDEAKKHWQDDERIADALMETDWFTESGEAKAGMERSAMTDNPPRLRPKVLPDLKVLWKGDQLSVQQIFENLETLEDENEADQLTAVLLSLRPDMKEALFVAVYSENKKLLFHAARGLAASVTPQEAFLLYPFLFGLLGDRLSETERETIMDTLNQRNIEIPSQEQSAKILFDRATDYFERRRPVRADADGIVSFWDSEKNTGNIIYRSENIETAYKYFAMQYYNLCRCIASRDSVNYKFYQSADLIS